MVTRIAIMLGVMLASVAWGQTLHQTDQNVFDLNPERDALTGLSGSQRIRADFYGDPGFTDSYDLSQSLPLTLTITTTQDAWTVTSTSVSNVPPNRVYWSFSVGVGVYRLQSTANLPGDNVPVFDRFLVVTSAPTSTGIGTINVDYYTGGIVSNVTEGTSNAWNAGDGELIIDTNSSAYLESEWATNTAAQIIADASTGGGTTNANEVGVQFTPTNATFASQDVEAALVGIDSALGSVGGGGGGDAYLSSNQTFTGVNTFANNLFFHGDLIQTGRVILAIDEESFDSYTVSGPGQAIIGVKRWGGADVDIVSLGSSILIGAHLGYARVDGTANTLASLGGYVFIVGGSASRVFAAGYYNVEFSGTGYENAFLGGRNILIDGSSTRVVGLAGDDQDATNIKQSLMVGDNVEPLHNGTFLFNGTNSATLNSTMANQFVIGPNIDVNVGGNSGISTTQTVDGVTFSYSKGILIGVSP